MALDTESVGHDLKTTDDVGSRQDVDYVEDNGTGSDAEFGGCEERRKMEKKLVRRLDARMSILIVIYILNYVSFFFVLPRPR